MQEPRLLSALSGDDNMVNAYKEGKDLYATIATGIYKNTYWDNMEHFEDGTPNPAGKKRRSNCKSILLGIMYGRGAASIADQIGESYQEAQKIIDDFYNGFPKVKYWVDKSTSDAKLNGYVEDFWGRRRRLPDLKLPKYTITDKSSKNTSDVNPLLYCKGIVSKTVNPLISKYESQLEEARGWQQVRKIKDEAAKNNIDIRDNGAFISQAERQCVNARVQGSAATMSKIAMIHVFNNKELRELGFRILLQVHDELIGECPRENAERVAEVLSDVMRHCAEPEVSVPFRCDTYIVDVWYQDDYFNYLHNMYEKSLDTKTEQDALNELFEEHPEIIRNDENISYIKDGYPE